MPRAKGKSKGRWAIFAIAMAVIAALAILSILGLSDKSSPDAYTKAVDRLCLKAQQKITQAERRYRGTSGENSFVSSSEALARIVGDVRAQIGNLETPDDRIEDAIEMESAMLESEQQLIETNGTPGSSKAELVAAERQARVANANVKITALALGVSQCSHLALAPPK